VIYERFMAGESIPALAERFQVTVAAVEDAIRIGTRERGAAYVPTVWDVVRDADGAPTSLTLRAGRPGEPAPATATNPPPTRDELRALADPARDDAP